MRQNTRQAAVPPAAWMILAVIFFSGLAAPLNQFKAPPVLQDITQAFGVTLGAGGWLMSVFSMIGVALALPAGFIIGRLGVKRSGILALACLLIGCFCGALAQNIGAMLFGRILEGMGMCFMSIVAPTALAAWFPPERRGLAMGVWGTWIPFASIFAFAAAGTITSQFGWRGMWWASLVYTALVLTLFLSLFRMPEKSALPASPSTGFRREWQGMRTMLKKADPWRLAISFACYNSLIVALMSFMTPYLTQERGLTSDEARFWVTCLIVVNMLAVLGGGLLSDALGTRKKCILASHGILAFVMLFYFQPGHNVIAVMLLVGGVSGLVVTPSLSAAPEVARRPEDTGRALSILAVGTNGGMVLGPAVYGMIVDSAGWGATVWFSVPVMILGFVVAWGLKTR